jgi:phosphoglycerol transferase MdoB-like AlkP superfamily enzyme
MSPTRFTPRRRPLLDHIETRLLLFVAVAWLLTFFLTRSTLLVTHLDDAKSGTLEIARIYASGLLFDAVFLVYALLPIGLLILLVPKPWWAGVGMRRLVLAMIAVVFFGMMFIAVSEWIFWDEFGVRFNFIAVDYLVYSKEVVANIVESYPVFPLIGGLILAAVAMTFAVKKWLLDAFRRPTLDRKQSFSVVAVWVGTVVLASWLVGQDFPNRSGGNAYQKELSANGPYQFFAAFRNNEIDYRQFYATLPDGDVDKLLHAELVEQNSRFTDDQAGGIRRYVALSGQPNDYNLVIVTVESLSARYLGSFGDKGGLTPNLDALAKESLAFTRFYATGTRTDRGLEAITLSVPPTPGRSIVKRIGRESGYASLGQQLAFRGYDVAFIYGGRGYFDNMNAFFSGNGYRIVDQSSVPEAEIHFKNAWGMADEDLFAQTIKVADQDHAAGKPFFLQLMTTSNHRPYTYPDGRIDIPSGHGRDGAVKYTDYAIGRFIAEARKKPWFDRTIFVIVADHTAGSAGKEDLPVANYHIPLFILAPTIIKPRTYDAVASQIDIAPTLLGLLKVSYSSSFFGHDLLAAVSPPMRALIGNYQHLGLYDGKDLSILSPRRSIRRHLDADNQSREAVDDSSSALARRNIAYYQGASTLFRQGGLAWKQPVAGEKIVLVPAVAPL